MNKVYAIIIGLLLASIYGYFAFFTTVLKPIKLDMLFISSGIIVAPIGAAMLWVIESLGIVTDPGMGGGILIFSLGGFVVWFCIFTFISYIAINKYVQAKHH